MKPIKVYKIGSDSDANCIVETFHRLSQLKIYDTGNATLFYIITKLKRTLRICIKRKVWIVC